MPSPKVRRSSGQNPGLGQSANHRSNQSPESASRAAGAVLVFVAFSISAMPDLLALGVTQPASAEAEPAR